MYICICIYIYIIHIITEAISNQFSHQIPSKTTPLATASCGHGTGQVDAVALRNLPWLGDGGQGPGDAAQQGP